MQMFFDSLSLVKNIMNNENVQLEEVCLSDYTHYEMVLGVSGQEFAWNFDFSIEQNQRLSNAK